MTRVNNPSADPESAVRHSRLIDACPIFYGWVILVAATIGTVLTSPGQTYAISAFIDSFIQDLNLSRSLVSTLYTAGSLAGSVALTFVGRQIDARGPRYVGTITCILLGLTCVYMGFLQNAVMLVIGFCLLRMLGQGSLSMVCRIVINQWWSRRRGMAIGIVGVVSSILGSGSFPALIKWLIPMYGWRLGYVILGGLVAGLMLPVSLFLFRDRPEDYGLQPDGGGGEGEQSGQQFEEDNWTLDEAIRTRAFWLVSAGLSAMSALGTGMTFHFFSIFEDNGLSTAVIASIFVPIAATKAIVQLGGGFLIDRVPIRVVLGISLAMMAAVMITIPRVTTAEVALALSVVMGIRTGLQQLVSGVVWARFFGRRYLGAITGVTSTIGVASSALGSMPLGIARDRMGSYTFALTWLAVIPLILSLLNFAFGAQPVKKEGVRGGQAS
ncbi:MAG: hypothetical protein CME26_07545 [Gemmatimonadetes bacterium]|nr:hypothetical protein [Gemmatimonadota bacterium]